MLREVKVLRGGQYVVGAKEYVMNMIDGGPWMPMLKSAQMRRFPTPFVRIVKKYSIRTWNKVLYCDSAI
ncbi:MAG: hypothetical protein JRI86_14990 [Deltaproteobacteria bacterium]|nr:hypothetical protein [Deltaproteobacteria bacterium]